MNKREFVCRAAIELNAAFSDGGWGFTDSDSVWRSAEKLWDARPQWMKDEEKKIGVARQFANTIPTPNPIPLPSDFSEL